MRVKNFFLTGGAIILLLLAIFTAYYYWKISEDYVSNIFPPQFDNDLSFSSYNVCSNAKDTNFFEGWKKINDQALQLNDKFSSELLKNAAYVIEQLKKNQELYTQAQGEGQQFQYYLKNLKECVNRTKVSKLELEDLRNQTNQTLEKENKEIKKIKETIYDHQNQLQDTNKLQLEKKLELNIVIETLKSLTEQKERLQRSYKNESELKDYQQELDYQIKNISQVIAQQEYNIQTFKQKVEEQKSQFSNILRRFEVVENQLQDLKALEQYFRQDDLYIIEDVPIIQVIFEYSKTLKERQENLQILAKREKDPIQRQKNLEALNEIQKAQQISDQMYISLIDIKLDCNQDDCTIGTTLENFKLQDLKEEIQKKYTYQNQIYQEKQHMEYSLQTLMQQYDNENSAYLKNKSKLQKLIENENLLNKSKNQKEELQKLTIQINELESKKQNLKNDLDQITNKINDQQIEINTEQEKVEIKRITIDTWKMNRDQSITEKNQELYKQVKECIKQKKIYENFVQKQSNLIEKANQTKAIIQTEVRQIESMLNNYKNTYRDLNLQSNSNNQENKDNDYGDQEFKSNGYDIQIKTD